MHRHQARGDETVVGRLTKIADPALNRLSFTALLPALVERTFEALSAEGVVLYLADDAGVLQVRASMGDGVDVDAAPDVVALVANTLMRHRDGRAGAVAIVSEGSLIGVLFARSHDRRFTDEDMLLLQVAGNRCASAAVAAQLRASRRRLEATTKPAIPIPR
jgi:GAF domain-containing protein